MSRVYRDVLDARAVTPTRVYRSVLSAQAVPGAGNARVYQSRLASAAAPDPGTGGGGGTGTVDVPPTVFRATGGVLIPVWLYEVRGGALVPGVRGTVVTSDAVSRSTSRPRSVAGTAVLADAVARVVTPVGGGGGGGGGAGEFYEYTGTRPTVGGSVKLFTGGSSLASAIGGLASGDTLILRTNSVFNESFDLVLPSNVTIMNDAGFRPWVNGAVRLRCSSSSAASGAKVYGLNVKWTSPDPSGHMVKLDGGAIDFAFCEVTQKGNSAGCFTLLRPGQTLVNSQVRNVWCHDNPGVSSHDGNQDHLVYADTDALNANLLIHHNLLRGAPRGRDIKIGGPSAGAAFGGIKVYCNTLYTGYGPSNGQVSNGCQDTEWHHNILIDSGAGTNLTNGTGAGPRNTYHHNLGDRPNVGPNVSTFSDTGGNVGGRSLAYLTAYDARGAEGFGHLAA